MKKTVISRSCKALMSFVFISLPLDPLSHVRESGGILIFIRFILALRLSGWRVSSFSPRGGSVDVSFLLCQCSRRGPRLTLKQCTTLFLVHLGGGCRPLSYPTGLGDVAKLKYLTSSAADPFLWLPLPSSLLNLSAHIREILENS